MHKVFDYIDHTNCLIINKLINNKNEFFAQCTSCNRVQKCYEQQTTCPQKNTEKEQQNNDLWQFT